MRRLFLAATLALSLCVANSACNSHPQNVAHLSPAPRTRGEGRGEGPTATTVADAKTTLTYLASDELEGRGVGTPGLDLAANFIARQFTAAGLKTIPGQHNFFEPFEMTAASEVGPKTSLSTADRSFEPKKDF